MIQADIVQALEDRPAQFDLIVASDVLLYVGDLTPVFQAARQALRPGGRFAFTVDLLMEGRDYHLTRWVHFAHSLSYLRRLAAQTSLQAICVNRVVFPREGGQQADGLVIALRRPD